MSWWSHVLLGLAVVTYTVSGPIAAGIVLILGGVIQLAVTLALLGAER